MNEKSMPQETPTILFVEDEPNMRHLVEKVFLEKGYRILTAPNGIKAMEILVSTTPDLIVSDIMMPEMNGIDFFHAVQERFGENRPVFMFLTAKSDEDDIVSGFSLGAEDYITKPVSIRHLASKIEARIKQIQAQKKTLSTGLRGNLKDQGVADIVQFIELAEHTGRLKIDAFNREGQIQFRDGQIIWADFAPLSGLEAAYALMALKTGSFHFESTEDISATNRIKVDNFALILEAMKRIDEQGRDKLLHPVLEADTQLTIPDSTSIEDPAMVDTVTTADIPDTFRKEPSEYLHAGNTRHSGDTQHKGDTQQLRSIRNVSTDKILTKPREPIVVPEWMKSADFEHLGQAVAELESGDFQGRWVEWNPLREPQGFSTEEPCCCILSTREKVLEIFRVISEIFPDHSTLGLNTSNGRCTTPSEHHFQDTRNSPGITTSGSALTSGNSISVLSFIRSVRAIATAHWATL